MRAGKVHYYVKERTTAAVRGMVHNYLGDVTVYIRDADRGEIAEVFIPKERIIIIEYYQTAEAAEEAAEEASVNRQEDSDA